MKKVLATVFSFFILLTVFAQDKPEGLFINSKVPDFKALDQNGNEILFKDLRKKGNVVVIFYRGSWCPYCSKHLKRLQDSLELIKATGAQVIAITPAANNGVDSMVAKSGATFPIIHDKDMKIASAYKVAYKVDDKIVVRYKNSNPPIDLLQINDQKNAYLPVPAVYIVNKEGSVTFRYFDEDYKKRLSVKDILKELN